MSKLSTFSESTDLYDDPVIDFLVDQGQTDFARPDFKLIDASFSTISICMAKLLGER